MKFIWDKNLLVRQKNVDIGHSFDNCVRSILSAAGLPTTYYGLMPRMIVVAAAIGVCAGIGLKE
jgi:hypothetical protein